MAGLVQATWDDAPHLTEQQKAKLWAEIPKHEREARSKGIPMLGAGRIYPYPEDSVFCEPFEVPSYWPRAYGMDADWNNTAALWGAWDQEADIVYIYSEHMLGQAPPLIHATSIKGHGEWMTGAIDPSTNGKISAVDGARLLDTYLELGLGLVHADNAVEAGITAVQNRMTTNRLKIFNTCVATLAEYRIYRRAHVKDAGGRTIGSKIVKVNDHLMDALRYLIMTGMLHADVQPDDMDDEMLAHGFAGAGRDAHTGY